MMDMKQLGSLLRSERESKGIPLEELIRKTKISRSNLEAIEEGDIDRMPHPVYAKGFIKNYIQMLDIDVDDLREVLERNCPTEDCGPLLEGGDVSGRVISFDSDLQRKKRPLGLLAFSGLAFAVLMGLILSLDLSPLTPDSPAPVDIRGDTGEEKQAASNADGDHAQLQGDAPAFLSEPNLSGQTGPVEQSGQAAPGKVTMAYAAIPSENGVATGLEEPAAQEDAQVAASSALDDTDPDGQPAAGPAEPPSGQILRVTATEPCWMRVRIGTDAQDVYLEPGQSRQFSFDQALELRLGNGGGVEMSLNGEPYPLEAASGEVVVLSFS
ncbi:MAG: helix-turn-helix domain-containing protein [Desulfohalobiaceae bacterium]